MVGQLLYLGSERPELDGEGWESLGRPGRYRASEVHRRADGSYLFRSRSGFWFRLEPASSESGSREAWQRLADSAEMLALDR